MPIDMFKVVKHAIKTQYQIEITPDTKVKDVAEDSLDRLELLMRIEDVLDVNIPENLINEESTIKELISARQFSENN